MQFKKDTKQRNISFQGLRSFKNTLPKNIKKIINKKGHIYSETLNNWNTLWVKNYLIFVTQNHSKILIDLCKHSSNNGQRGHEVEIEYSKKKIIDKMNSFFGYTVVEKLKFISFHDNEKNEITNKRILSDVTIKKYENQIKSIKNEKIKKSLLELTKLFKHKWNKSLYYFYFSYFKHQLLMLIIQMK